MVMDLKFILGSYLTNYQTEEFGIMELEEKNILISIQQDIKELKEAFISIPKWISLTDVAYNKGLTPQAVRKKLIEHFEPEVDYTKTAHF